MERNCVEDGFRNEENARQWLQQELAVMKDEIKSLQTGCTVCSEASTGVSWGLVPFARPPTLSSRWIDTFIHKVH